MTMPESEKRKPWWVKLWNWRLSGWLLAFSSLCALAWIGAASSMVFHPPVPRPGQASFFDPIWVWQAVFVVAALLMVICHLIRRLYILAHLWAAASLVSLTITLLFAAAVTEVGWLTPSLMLIPIGAQLLLARFALPQAEAEALAHPPTGVEL